MKQIRLLFVMLMLVACGCSPCAFDEIDRIKSPDGIVDAVHVRGNCGATTPFSEHIFIVQCGAKTPPPKDGYQVFSAEHVEGLRLKWREPKVFEIQYKVACIFHPLF